MPGDPKPASSSEPARVFLVDGDGLERRLIDEWLEQQQPGVAREVVRISSTRAWDAGRVDPALAARLAKGDDPLLTPVRVAWLPRETQGERAVRLTDLLTLGNPRAPTPIGKRWVLARHPDRCRVVAGEAASASALRERWRQAGGESDEDVTASFSLFVLRQAALALERAERPLRGARYKVPRFVRQEISAHREFRAGLATLTASTGQSPERVRRRARHYLEEIAARVSPYVIDLVHRLIGVVYRQGYAGELDYDRARLQALLAPKPGQTVVFLPTHKSNLDHAILQYLLYDNGSPPNHTAGGINMNFFPVGPVFRRTGVFFIRRSFKDNPIYKFVLRQYVDFLVEKRFSLEWYIEGGRSRSGKLLPPRFGMLAWVVDSWRRGRADDVLLVPVSIAYDQISDVGDYAHEARGGAKQKEGLGWFVGMLRALKRRYGQIHVRFGEPASLKASLGPPVASPHATRDDDGEEKNLPVQKLAFEVCHRINQATPITPSAALCLALLGGGHRAVTVDELRRGLVNVVRYARARGLPTAGPVDELETAEGLTRHLQALAANGVVRCFDEGPEPVWSVVPTQFLTAAYYRNTVLHFFVTSAIAELSLLHAATASGDKRQAFDEEAMRLRDLLKFEFFFAEKDAFKKALADEVAFHAPSWEASFPQGADAVEAVVRAFKPFSAHRVLRPFVDADRIVADALLREGTAAVEEAPLIARCLGLGKQYVMQRLVHSEESVSKVLFATAFKLAAHRGLVSGDGLEEKRRAFAGQLKDVVRRIDAVEALAASRRAGLID
ncbi:MAG: glycerol-3-phosphate 1-O-acyltransferase [Myxococcaceae bacterium]|nr:glycerol-3-phosphate 1-O-acyltransferase [Myxococcaceae bacterium]